MTCFHKKNIINRLSEKIKGVWEKEKDAHRLSISLALSVYVAFLPTIGFHTLIAFIVGWLFNVSGFFIFSISHIIHNPLTALPIYISGHAFGQYILFLCAINPDIWNPSWLSSVNNYLAHHLGALHISLAAFIIGCNCLALILSSILYITMRSITFLYKRRYRKL